MDLFHAGAKRKRLGEAPEGSSQSKRQDCGHRANNCLTKSPCGIDTDRRGAPLGEVVTWIWLLLLRTLLIEVCHIFDNLAVI